MAKARPALTDSTPPTARWRVHLAAMAGLIVLTAGLYAVGLGYPLIWDDMHVAANPHIRSLDNVGWFFSPAYWREQKDTRSYRPIVETANALNWAATGGTPAGLRAVNIALLGVAAALVYWLTWRLARSLSAAVVAGLIFAAHPTHLETVALVKNRSEILAGVFGLLALLWFLRAASGTRRGRWWVWWLASIVATALALGSKEVALALPLVMTAAALLLVPRPALSGRAGCSAGGGVWGNRSGRGHRRALVLTAPMWGLAAGFLVLLFTSMPARYARPLGTDRLELLEFAALGPGARGLVVAKTAGTYLGLLVWPFAPCADRAFEIPRDLWRADILASLAAMLAVAVLAVWSWRHGRRVAAFALVWLAAAMAPVANLVPVASRPIAEQRLFAATIAFAILVGLLAGKRCQEPFSRNGRKKVPDTLFLVVLVVWVVAAGGVTVGARLTWRTGLALWARAAEQSPSVRRAQYNYGDELGKAGRFDEAVDHLRRAVQLDDGIPYGVANLARALMHLGRHEEAQRLLRLSLAWQPDAPWTHGELAWEMVREGRAEAATFEFRAAVRLEPTNPHRHFDLAQALLQTDRAAEAIESLRRARDLAPDEAHLWMALAEALAAVGRYREALAEYVAVIQRWPGEPSGREAKALADRIRPLVRRE